MEEWDYLEGHMEFYKEVMTDNLQKTTMMEGLQKKTMMEGLQKKTMMEDIQMEARQRKTMMDDLQNKTIMEDLQKNTMMAEQCLGGDKEAMMEDHKMDGSYTQDLKAKGTSLHVKNEGLMSEITLVKEEEAEIPVTVKEEERTLEVATDGSYSQDLKDHCSSQHVKDEGLEVDMAVVKDEGMDFPKTVKEEEVVIEVGKGEPDAQVGQIYNIQEALENSVILNIQPALPLANRAVEIPNTEESPAWFEEPSSTKQSGLGNSMIFYLVIGSEGGWAEDIEDPQRSRIEIESCSDSEAVKPMEDDVGETLPSKVIGSNVQDSGSSEKAASVEVEVTPTEGCSKQKTPSGSMVQITPKCEECGKTFSNKKSLVAHQKRHLISPMSCSMCDKTFTHKSSLRAHERMHSGKLTYSCSECGKVFLKKVPRDIHQRRHRGEKPYVCVDCGKCFAVKGDVISHQRVHTQERPYSCLVCSKSFGKLFNLQRHQTVHNAIKSYMCSTCGKCYAQKQDLLCHQKVHAGDAQAMALEDHNY